MVVSLAVGLVPLTRIALLGTATFEQSAAIKKKLFKTWTAKGFLSSFRRGLRIARKAYMKNFRVSFLLGLIFLMSSWAQAKSQASMEFIRAVNEIPQALIENGYGKIGRLDLKKIVANLNKIELREEAWVETEQPQGQKRIFARWERTEQGPRVILNTSTWSSAHPKFRGSLAIHEVLGAGGFNDEDYNLSTSLWLLKENSQQKVLKRSEVNYILERIAEESKSGGGGVIGVGGGGDVIGPGLKISMLQAAFERYQKDPSEENRIGIFNTYGTTQMFSVEGGWKWAQ